MLNMHALAHLDARSFLPFHGREGRHILSLEISDIGDGSAGFEGVVHNLSSSGMMLETSAPFTVGDSFVLTAPHDDQVEATVVWKDGAFFGCKFERRLSAADVSAARLMSGFDKPAPVIDDQARTTSGPVTPKAYLPPVVADHDHTGGLTLRARAATIGFLSIVAWAPLALAVTLS